MSREQVVINNNHINFYNNVTPVAAVPFNINISQLNKLQDRFQVSKLNLSKVAEEQ